MNSTFNISSNNFINAVFKRINVDKINMKTITPTISAYVGQNLTYNISVSNVGNRPETVSLEATGTWNVTFSDKSLTLMPGGNKYVLVHVIVSDRASLGMNTISIRGIYQNSSIVETNIYVNAYAYHNISFQWGNTYINGNNIMIH